MAICIRCGGTGSYSYHPKYGRKCFRCLGTGEDPAQANRILRETTQSVLSLPADRKGVWYAVMHSLPTLGEPYEKADCPVHGEQCQLNKLGRCSQCSIEESRKLCLGAAA